MEIIPLVPKTSSTITRARPRELVAASPSLQVEQIKLIEVANLLENSPDISHFRGYYLKQVALVILSKLTSEIIKPAGVFLDPDCVEGHEYRALSSMSLPVPFAIERARVYLARDNNLLVQREFERAIQESSFQNSWKIFPLGKTELNLPHELENDFNSYWLPEKQYRVLRCLEECRRSMLEVTLYLAYNEEALDSLISARAIPGEEGDYQRGLALGIPESAVSWFVKTTGIERNNAAHGFLVGGSVLPASLKDKGSCWWEPSYPPSQEEIQLASRASEILEQLECILPQSVSDRFSRV